jgi:hypothetical protein
MPLKILVGLVFLFSRGWFLLISFVDPVGFGPSTDSSLTSTKNKPAVSLFIN